MSLGIDTAVVHFSGRRKASPTDLAGASVGCSLLLGSVGIVCALAALQFLYSDSLLAGDRTAANVLIATIPISLLILYWQAVLRSIGRILEVSAITILSAVLTLLGSITALEAGLGLSGVLLAYATVEVFVLAVTMGTALTLGLRSRRIFNITLSRNLARYGLRGHLGTILQGLNYRLDVFIVALLLTAADVGIYTVAVAAGEFLWLVPNAIGVLLVQRGATSSEARATRITALATRTVSSISILLAATWMIAAEPIISMTYGADFTDAVGPIRLLMPGIWALSIWKNLANDLSGRGRPEYKSYTAAIGAIATVGLDVVLIPHFGLTGAAVATTCAYLAAALSMVILYRRATGADLRTLLILQKGDAIEVLRHMRTAFRRNADPTSSSGALAAPTSDDGRPI